MVRRFTKTRFAAFLMRLTRDIFTAPSQQSFMALALGWTFAMGRHTIATYLWRSAATSLKHFTRFYIFLGAPFHGAQDKLFDRVIQLAVRHMPEEEPIRVYFDETTCKKSGRHIEGTSRYRNGAGSARQEYRTLFGLNFVLGILRLPLTAWPSNEAYVSLPVGLRLYLKKSEAEQLNRSYHSRSELARQILDRVAEQVGPNQTVLSVQDGDYSTKTFLRGLPENVEVVGRLPIDSKLYEAPSERPPGKPGPQPRKGELIGSAKTLAQKDDSFQPHPNEEGAEVHVTCGIWDSVLPEVLLRVVVVRRPEEDASKKKLEAFFTTRCSKDEASEEPAAAGSALAAEGILREYGGRWSVEIVIREAKQFGGLGQDRCRRLHRIEGVNAFRLFMLAATRLHFAKQIAGHGELDLTPQRPWYKEKEVPSGRDVLWACREELLAEGITPTVGFKHTARVSHRKPTAMRSRAA